MALNPAKFKKPAAPVTAKPPVRKSRYGGIGNRQERDPMPEAGTYRFRVLEVVEGMNPGTGNESIKVSLEVVEQLPDQTSHAIGDTVKPIFMRTPIGLQEFKCLVVAASGYGDAEEYDVFDPDGEFMGAFINGDANAYSEAGLTIYGRLVDGVVKRGKARDDGDYYRNYAWSPVEDAEQDQVGKAELP